MNGYVAQRRGRFYAVIYEGRDPVTGKERRSWHPAGTDRAEAERLAAKLAAKENRPRRRSAVVDVRRLPDQPVAPGQEAAPRDQHVSGLRTQRAAPHPPHAGADQSASCPIPADRSALRHAPAPDRRTRARPQDRLRDPPDHPRIARRRRTTRARHPQRRPGRSGTQAAVTPTDRGPGAGPRKNCVCSCAPLPGTGTSRSCG